MYLEFFGAADGVTGSLHRVHLEGPDGGVDIVLDAGLYQGRRADANRRNREPPPWAIEADALVLSHAHIDHSGNIPTLIRQGFDGNVFCTPPTRDLCSVMLRDSAMIQLQDARYLNKRRAREGGPRVEPLYDVADAQRAVERMISLPLHRPLPIAPGVTLRFHEAGHVLGSALVELELLERGVRRRLLYTGDLGRAELPLLPAPEIVPDVNILLMESTYGDRSHPDIESMDEKLASIIVNTVERRGVVYIPTFALERAQEVLFALDRLHAAKRIPRIPIFIDSPLAIAITEIYKLHPQSLDAAVSDRILARDDPFSPPELTYVSDVEASKRLQASDTPCIVIAGSGMCEGGRIVHHFRLGLGKPENSVVIVGFMAQHTLGRRLVEGKKKVNVLGVPRDVAAQIHSLSGLSAHADERDLVAFARATAKAGRVSRIGLVHGEQRPREVLAERLTESGLGEVVIAAPGKRIEL